MNTLPIDQSKITTIIAGEAYEAKDMTGNQALTKEGKPMWFIPVLLTSPKSRPEMVRVKIANNQNPKVIPGHPVKFIGLQVIVWELNGKHGVSFKAEAIETLRP